MYRSASSLLKLRSNLFHNRLSLSTAADGSAAAKMLLNFCLPHETIYRNAEVAQVILPGVDGEYGVTVNHIPIVSQLKPGVVQVLFNSGDPEKYFVAGGFALTHPNSVTDVSCPEAVKLDDLDGAAIQKNYEAAKAAFSSAEVGSVAKAEAEIAMETNKAMATAIGLAI